MYFKIIITSGLIFFCNHCAYAMEQIITDIKKHIQADCYELKCNTADTRDSLNPIEDIFLKPNLILRTIVGKDFGGIWTMITKRYSGDNPLCTIRLTYDQKLESAEHVMIQQLLIRIASELNRSSKKSKTPPYLFLSAITLSQDTHSFALVGLLKH